MLRGIDISAHQSTTPTLDGLAFIVLRASIATTPDTKYAQHYAAARKAGLVVMAYHFGYSADQSPIAGQVETFLEAAKDADFLWLDQEEQGFTDAQAQTFIDAVRLKGRSIGLYHSASGFGGVNSDAKWVADWRDASEVAGHPRTADGSREFPNWTLWQYDGAGADNLDNNYWNPDRPIAELLRKSYVAKAAYDAEVAELNDTIHARDAQIDSQIATIAALRADILTQANEITALGAAFLEAQAQRDAAPAIERDRIAAAEADRIRAL